MNRRAFLILLPGAVAACTTPPEDPATLEEVQAVAYRHGAPYNIQLFTMISNKNGSGAHSSMMINAPSQRVVFDPAGSVRHPLIKERGDVLYGITPRIADFYARAHARSTFHVVIHTKEVPGEVAELALRKVQANGPTPSAFCANHSSSILRTLPGFESMRTTFYPLKLMEQFQALPGVTERKIFENDADDKAVAIEAFEG